jgi:hypothetical protein
VAGKSSKRRALEAPIVTKPAARPLEDTSTREEEPSDFLEARERQLSEFIRAHPLGVVGGALALGFVAARIVRWARDD